MIYIYKNLLQEIPCLLGLVIIEQHQRRIPIPENLLGSSLGKLHHNREFVPFNEQSEIIFRQLCLHPHLFLVKVLKHHNSLLLTIRKLTHQTWEKRVGKTDLLKGPRSLIQ